MTHPHLLPLAGACRPPAPFYDLLARKPIFSVSRYKFEPIEDCPEVRDWLSRMFHRRWSRFRHVDRPGEIWGEEVKRRVRTLTGQELEIDVGSCNDWTYLIGRELIARGWGGAFRAVYCTIAGEPKAHLVAAAELEDLPSVINDPLSWDRPGRRTTLIFDQRQRAMLHFGHAKFDDYTWISASEPGWWWGWRAVARPDVRCQGSDISK